LPDCDDTDEGYVVLRDALAKSRKVSIGQLIMHGREHLVGITAQGKGLVLVILRYADELRKPEPYFEKIETKAKDDAVRLAVDLRATSQPLALSLRSCETITPALSMNSCRRE
jgi:DNA end-binding protein Ku